jgi:hypothetical protein
MTHPDTAALPVALAYHQAWTSQDFDQALTHIDPHIICDAPAGRLEGADAFRAFMGPFAGIATGSRVIAAFGDGDQAVVMYDTATRAVPDAPGAEYVTVAGGRITYMRIIFDRLPFENARRAAAAS